MGDVELESKLRSPLKYAARPALVSGGTMLRIHNRRKKAIMAVTKSAYATFHAPPPIGFLLRSNLRRALRFC